MESLFEKFDWNSVTHIEFSSHTYLQTQSQIPKCKKNTEKYQKRNEWSVELFSHWNCNGN